MSSIKLSSLPWLTVSKAFVMSRADRPVRAPLILGPCERMNDFSSDLVIGESSEIGL